MESTSPQGSLYTIIFGYKEKTSALRAGRMAVKLVKAILKGQPVNMGQWISELKDMLIKGMLVQALKQYTVKS